MGARGRFKSGSLGPTDPSLAGIISAWLRVPLATVTGSGISSLPDTLNSNPAVQASDLLRPPRGTSANGLSIISPVSDVMTVPLIAANNATSQWGLALHLRSPNGAASRSVWVVRAGGGADFNRINVAETSTESFGATINIDDLNNRAGFTTASQIGDNTWHFVTVEFDGTQATEIGKLTITIDGIVKTLTFSNPSGVGAMPATLVNATGSALLLANNTAASSQPWIGDIGPNIYIVQSKMVGATEGLLTAAARFSLGAFERPT